MLNLLGLILVPSGKTSSEWLRELTLRGIEERYPDGPPVNVLPQIEKELRTADYLSDPQRKAIRRSLANLEVMEIMAGADTVQVASAVLKNGIPFLEALLEDVVAWMVEHGYESIDQMKGSMSQQSVADPAAFERANYIKTLSQYKSPYAV